MLSSVYQQGSGGSVRGAAVDPENRLLWRMNRRRLDWEAMRDGVLAVSGQLDRSMAGPPVDVLAQPFSKRRSVYAFIDRQNLPGTFRIFDFANPDTHSPQRHTTMVPQQALFLMNSPFMLEQARHLAARPEVTAASGPAGRIEALYGLVYGRPPTPGQTELGIRYFEAESAQNEPAPGAGQPLSPWERYAQALLLSNEFMFVD